MKITDFDKNFELPALAEKDVLWHDINSSPFSIHGVFYDEENSVYRRLDEKTAKAVSPSVLYGSCYGVGGRIRFKTDSPYISIKCACRSAELLAHSPACSSHGFALYLDGKYSNSFFPLPSSVYTPSASKTAFTQTIRFDEVFKEREVEICLPLYNAVHELYIGVKDGAKLLPPTQYKHEKPIVYYGSSITQGGCASHAGNEYPALVSRWLDSDYLNLGFSGGAKGEPQMAQHLSNLDPSVFVLDYDYNAPTEQHLKSTYKPLFDTIREKHPTTPIVMITSPNTDSLYHYKERKEIIFSVYNEAKEQGDNNVYFVDGESFYGEDRDFCTVDLIHPNDLGFYKMAKKLYPLLDKILNG